MLTNKDIKVDNFIGIGKVYSDISGDYKVLSIGNDEQEFEQIYTEGEESFEWLFKDGYCGIPLSDDWFDKLLFSKQTGIMITYSFILIDYKGYDDILKKMVYHYKEISLSKNNKDTYYVYIREGYTDDRSDDDIITFSNNYKYVHQVQQLLSCAKF